MSTSANPEKKLKALHTQGEKLRTMEFNKPETNLTDKNLVIRLNANITVIKYKCY